MRRLLEGLGARAKRQLPGLTPEERAALSDAVGKLGYREARVLELRYGLWGEDPHTLGEVADIFRLSPHRIQRIEQQALKKLPVRSARSSAFSNSLISRSSSRSSRA
jgi:DNA-directed RNA polymerase sigma subunit (sigma70/sigma32)